MSSPTQRSLAACRKEGLICAVVEKWNPHSKTRHDLFGLFDLLVLDPESDSDGRIYGIQVCAGASHAARKAKMLAEPRLEIWKSAGGKAVIHSWTKKGPRGKRKMWSLRTETL